MKIKQLCFVSGVALATLVTASAAQAALVVVPADLAPGAQYRLVFVTAGTRNATSTNIDDYNTFVTNEATGGTPAIDTALDTALNGAGFDLSTITWKAIGSTASVDARDNTGTNPTLSTGVPIYLIDGNRVANNNADLWDGSIQTAINRTPLDTVSTSLVWTGTTFFGLATSYALGGCFGGCDFGNGFVARGSSNVSFRIGGSWIFGFVDFYLDHLPLYGISPVLTVPTPAVTVPEPSSLLGFITLGGLMLGGAVRLTGGGSDT
ncbi:PEP-CTERM sorting domain-containing protein [Microcystis aeruginosa BLCCF158]|uniref:PEP-CTERM sorting domain-containing protein n=1 Tax=Microcystis aeruginosa BLCC-F158 TaxID=2755316 RepID=A0A841UVQ0_MICAE|nr:PEP-CTERM sorting domain-containing protein [Microcystis aeruginosa]MBC1194095.1 PEP-CTERM sorting domain-containing protein [Microcystis aeruginosa BLCC-F158]